MRSGAVPSSGSPCGQTSSEGCCSETPASPRKRRSETKSNHQWPPKILRLLDVLYYQYSANQVQYWWNLHPLRSSLANWAGFQTLEKWSRVRKKRGENDMSFALRAVAANDSPPHFALARNPGISSHECLQPYAALSMFEEIFAWIAFINPCANP